MQRTYHLKNGGEIKSQYTKHKLNKESFLSGEVAEPFRGLDQIFRLINSNSFQNKVPNLNIKCQTSTTTSSINSGCVGFFEH